MHVSVVLPVYNCQRYVAEAINSVLRQTHRDFDLVVIDDGSSDRAADVCRGFARHDGRITFVTRPNRGHCHTMNEGLALARGEWVAVMHCDDVMLPNRLERQVAFVTANPRLSLVSSLVEWIDEEGGHVGYSRSDLTTPDAVAAARAGEGTIAFPHPAVMFRKAAVQAVGGYRQAFYPVEDLDLWNRIADARYGVLVQPEVLMKYRTHPASATNRRAAEVAHCLRWLAATIRARRAGLPEPTRAEFEAAEAALPWPVKLNGWRKVRGDVAWNRAMANYAGHRVAAAVGPLALAVALRPATYVPRVVPRLFGHDADRGNRAA